MKDFRRRNHNPLVFVGGALLLSHVAQVAGQETTTTCPTGSMYHCDNPTTADAVWSVDPTVQCDPETCEWQTNLFSPTEKPVHCVNLEIIRASDQVSDFLEPCLLWELIYGDFAPTAAPTVSLQPSTSPQPSAVPSSFPTISPTMIPTEVPTSTPSKLVKLPET